MEDKHLYGESPQAALDNSVRLALAAVEALGDDLTSCPEVLHTLSKRLYQRCQSVKRAEDLDAAIQYGQEAVKLTPTDSVLRGPYAHYVAYLLRFRYESTSKVADLTDAISSLQIGVEWALADNMYQKGEVSIRNEQQSEEKIHKNLKIGRS
jgi:hypothetical protein